MRFILANVEIVLFAVFDFREGALYNASCYRLTSSSGMAKTKTSAQKIQPLGDKVLIKPLSDDEMNKKSPSGIIIPDTVDREKADRGTVVAVGDGKRSEQGDVVPLRVKAGEKVLFQWGDKVEIEDEEYYIVGESNVLAILK